MPGSRVPAPAISAARHHRPENGPEIENPIELYPPPDPSVPSSAANHGTKGSTTGPLPPVLHPPRMQCDKVPRSDRILPSGPHALGPGSDHRLPPANTHPTQLLYVAGIQAMALPVWGLPSHPRIPTYQHSSRPPATHPSPWRQSRSTTAPAAAMEPLPVRLHHSTQHQRPPPETSDTCRRLPR
jgi:hypothetical protein